MKNLELLDLENISGGYSWTLKNIEDKYKFYAIMSLEVIAFVSLLAGVVSKVYLYDCDCTNNTLCL